MRRATVVVAIAVLLALPAVALAAEAFHAQLSVDQEVPPPTVPAGYGGSGEAHVTISDDAASVEYEVTYEGLTGPLTMAHIHWGERGQAGPPIFWLTEMGVSDTPSPLTGTLTEADFMSAEGGPQTFAEALQAMRAGNTYVNLHTDQNQPGEIRGQLRLVPDSATQAGADTGAATGMMLLLLALGGLAFVAAFRRLSIRPI